MSKKGISQIKGPSEIKIGETAWYEISRIHRLEDQHKVVSAKWELSKRENGKWRTLCPKAGSPPKVGAKVPVTITNPALVNQELLIEAYIYEAEKTAPPGLKVKILPAVEKKITRVELFMVDDTPITKETVLKYNQTIKVKVYTQAMPGEMVTLTLYEDDATGGGHDAKNEPNKVAEITKPLDEQGFLWHEFRLLPNFSAIANAMLDGSQDKLHEYYVVVKTAEHKSVSKNTNVENPDYVPLPPVLPSTPSPVMPPANAGTLAPASPTEEIRGETVIEEVIIIGKKKNEIGVDPIPPSGNKPVVVVDSNVEDLLDAYFAKEEYTKETDDTAENYTYAFKNANSNIDKNKISAIIKKNVDSSIKAQKKYTKLESIKNSLAKTSYTKGETISFATYKLGADYKRINSAPLEDEVYLVASTMNLEGKEVSINIYEKEELLKGRLEMIPVLEAKENGAELTTLKATVEKGIAKVKVKLRPKSDEDLKKWKEKLQGIKDGTHTYKFGGNNDTSTEAKKKSVAQVIVDKVKQQLTSSKKFAKAEDIVKVLTKTSYNKDEQITFEVYKAVTEQWWLKAECTGEKKHEGEFLKKEGAYFTIGKKCECEARIRAFLRMLRVGEGTGEFVKSRDKETKEIIYVAHDFEKGYTTAFGGNLITDLSDHPRINYGGSTAAGAYQVMKNTWDDSQYTSNKTKYNINSFSKENQDKFSVLLMKHHPGCSDLLDLLLNGQTENSIRGRGSRIWASLPEKGDNSRYLFKGEPQPVTPMKIVLEHYQEFLKDELIGKSPLHLKKGFLQEFGINCNCDNKKEISVSENWHNPLDRMELRGWYSATQWTPEKSDWHGRTGGAHDGLDLYAPVETPTYACVSGKVADVYLSSTYGNTITIQGEYNGKTYYFFYAHLKSAVTFEIGNPINAGMPIGFTGQTGNANGQAAKMAHLHFEVRSANTRTGNKVNPNLITDMIINKNPNRNSQT